MGDYLLRLMIALPLVCALAVALLLLWRRWGGASRWPALRRAGAPVPRPLSLLATERLSASAMLAVVRFDGRDHLLGLSAAGLTLLSSAPVQPASEGEKRT